MSSVPAPGCPAPFAPNGHHTPTVLAVQHVKKMRGGAQSHLMRCSDGCFYVVKFRNNPQHSRVLANEMLATGLAHHLGLPVPAAAIVEVGMWLVSRTPELTMQGPASAVPCEAGLQFGSQYAVSPLEGQVFDHLPAAMLSRVRNLECFAGILALDKWTCNTDGRQATFWRRMRERRYTVTFIDQGHCFNAGDWTFPDHGLRGIYCQNDVYAGITGWESFTPWLPRIEEIEEDVIRKLAGEIPPEWYESDWDGLNQLVTRLMERRAGVRDLLSAFRLSPRKPFVNWGACSATE